MAIITQVEMTDLIDCWQQEIGLVPTINNPETWMRSGPYEGAGN